jgi:23S rRNA (adenine2503-C2)-methyltransferase
VLQTIALLGTEGGIGHKNLVFSTVGDRRVFDRLPRERVRPALALSLHTTRDELRAQLLPRAPRIAPQELIELGEAYARTGGYPIQYQWTLIAGVNDTDEEVTTLARLLAGKSAVMNFIPVNAVPDSDFARPPAHRAIEMVRRAAAANCARVRWANSRSPSTDGTVRCVDTARERLLPSIETFRSTLPGSACS